MTEHRIGVAGKVGHQKIKTAGGFFQPLEMPGRITVTPRMVGHHIEASRHRFKESFVHRHRIAHVSNFKKRGAPGQVFGKEQKNGPAWRLGRFSAAIGASLFFPRTSTNFAGMKTRIKSLRATAIPLAACLAFTGCSNLTPGENAAVAAAATGLAVGLPLALTGVNPAVTIPVTAGAAVLAGGGTYLLARNQASKRQRLVAEERARTYAARTGEFSKRSTRYIAVRTEEGGRAQGKAQVMIYDIHSGTIVNDTVYDMQSVPPVGETGNFGGYTARYIGTGA